MADHVSPPSPLVQRLAIDRVQAPGVIDRLALQRTYQKIPQPARTPLLDRLQRRIVPATRATESLPLVRAERSGEPLAVASAIATDGGRGSRGISMPAGRPLSISAGTVSTGTVQRAVETSQRASLPIARASGRVARPSSSSPGTASPVVPAQRSSDEIVAQRVAPPSGGGAVGSDSLVLQRSLDPARTSSIVGPSIGDGAAAAERSRSVAPAMSVASAAGDRVQRAAEHHVASVAMAGQSERGRIAPAPSGVVAGPPLPASSPQPANAGRSGTGGPATVAALPRVRVENVVPSPRALLWRKADPSASSVVARGVPVAARAPANTAAPAHLVLRKPDAVARASTPVPPTPSISTAPPDVIARTAAPGSAAGHHGSNHHDSGASTSGYGEYWSLDWITEQVGLRLARRLEVERERMGVRQWRS